MKNREETFDCSLPWQWMPESRSSQVPTCWKERVKRLSQHTGNFRKFQLLHLPSTTRRFVLLYSSLLVITKPQPMPCWPLPKIALLQLSATSGSALTSTALRCTRLFASSSQWGHFVQFRPLNCGSLFRMLKGCGSCLSLTMMTRSLNYKKSCLRIL